MTWNTSLTDFADGGTPTAAQLNSYLENMEWLRTPPAVGYEYSGTADFTTSAGTTWGTISSNFGTSIVCADGATLLMYLSLTVTRAEIDVSVDGTRLGATAGTGIAASNINAGYHTINIIRPFFEMDAGTHTFEVQWRAPYAATATLSAAYAPRFHVREL